MDQESISNNKDKRNHHLIIIKLIFLVKVPSGKEKKSISLLYILKLLDIKLIDS